MNFSFADEYKQWSNEQLFELLKNKQLYQPAAVAEAEFEFNSRKLTEAELEILETRYADIQLHKQTKTQKLAKEKVQATTHFILNEVNPLTKKTEDFRLRVFCYSIGVLILITLAVDFDTIKFIFKYKSWTEPSEALFLSQYFFVPMGLYFFWSKKNLGWRILTIWLTIMIVLLIVNFYQEIISYSHAEEDDSSTSFIHFTPSFYYGPPDYINHSLSILLYGSILFYINTQIIIGYFNLSRKAQWLTVGITAILSFIYLTTR